MVSQSLVRRDVRRRTPGAARWPSLVLSAVLAGCTTGASRTPDEPARDLPTPAASVESRPDEAAPMPPAAPEPMMATPSVRIVPVEPGAELGVPSAAMPDSAVETFDQGGIAIEQVAFAGGEVGAVAALGDDLLIGLGIQLLRVSPDATGAFEVVARSPGLPGIVKTIHVDGRLAYVGTSRGLVVVALDEGDALGIVGALGGLPVDGMVKVDHWLVIAVGGSDNWSVPFEPIETLIVDALDPTHPWVAARLEMPDGEVYGAYSLGATGNRAYLTAWDRGFLELDFGWDQQQWITSIGAKIQDELGIERGVDQVASGGGRVLVVEHVDLGDYDRLSCTYLVGDSGGDLLYGQHVGCSKGYVKWAAIDWPYAFALIDGHGRRLVRWNLHGDGVMPRAVNGIELPVTVSSKEIVIYHGEPHAVIWSGVGRVLTFTPVAALAEAQREGGHEATRTVHLYAQVGNVLDVDACGPHAFGLGYLPHVRMRWVSHYEVDDARAIERIRVRTMLPIQPFAYFETTPDGYAYGDQAAEQLACRADLLAVVGTQEWDSPKVQVALYDTAKGPGAVRIGIEGMSAAYCFQENGAPAGSSCWPREAADLSWLDDLIRVDFTMGDPMWFDATAPNLPRRLTTPPTPRSRTPRLHGGDKQSGAKVVAHAGYDYVVYPSDEGFAHPEEHSILAIHDLAAGTAADAFVKMPLATPMEVEAALIEVGGRAFLLASSRAPGLHVIALDDPAAPVLVGHIDLPQPAEAIAVAGDLVHVAVGRAGLVVFRARVE